MTALATVWLAALGLLLLEGLWLLARGMAPVGLLHLPSAGAPMALLPAAVIGLAAWLLAGLLARVSPRLLDRPARPRIWIGGLTATLAALATLLLIGPGIREHHQLVVLAPWLLAAWTLQPAVKRGPRPWLLAAALTAVLSLGAGGLMKEATLAMAMDRSSLTSGFARLTWRLADLDRDRRSPLLGRAECDDLDGAVGRGAVEVAGNGVDDNCMGGDLKTAGGIAPEAPLFPAVRMERRPDIFMISLDGLRADHVNRRLTPNIHRLLAASTSFSRAYAHAPYSSGSLGAMWTSSPLLSMVQGKRWLGFEASVIELLVLAGYQAVAVTDMPATWITTLGFGRVDQVATPADAEQLTDRALDHVIRHGRQRPLLLWVHYYDPHAPYLEHAGLEHLGGDEGGRYAQEVAHVDRHLGRLLGGLRHHGRLEKSVVVFFSDHGESLGEGGRRYHGWSLAEEAVRVPLGLRAPGLTPRRVETPVSLLDLAPTIMDLLGAAAPPAWQGRSLTPALRGQPLASRPVFLQADYHGEQGPSLAVIEWPWKYTEAAPFGLARLERLAPGSAASFPSARLRRLLGRHLDSSLNDRVLARRRRWLSAQRPGCAWKVKVGKVPPADLTLERGLPGGRAIPCGAGPATPISLISL